MSELLALIDGHELDHRDAWVRTRWLAYWTLMPHRSKEDAKKAQPTDLILFPWEGATVKKPIKDRKAELLKKQQSSNAFFEKFDKLKADGKIVALPKKESNKILGY